MSLKWFYSFLTQTFEKKTSVIKIFLKFWHRIANGDYQYKYQVQDVYNSIVRSKLSVKLY